MEDDKVTRYIIDLLPTNFWYGLFVFMFFVGLFLISLIILGGFASHHDVHIDDMSNDLHLDFHHDIGHDFSHEIGHDVGGHIDHSFDHHVDVGDSHVELHDGQVLDENAQPKTKHLLGNISSFMLGFGQVGWMNWKNLSDQSLIFALLIGIALSKLFAFVLGTYAKTTYNPIYKVSQGDSIIVTSQVTPEKAGLVNVTRKDGVINTVLAIGAFPHDRFEVGDKGHIWGKEGNYYTVTHVFWNQKRGSNKAMEYSESKTMKSISVPKAKEYEADSDPMGEGIKAK